MENQTPSPEPAENIEDKLRDSLEIKSPSETQESDKEPKTKKFSPLILVLSFLVLVFSTLSAYFGYLYMSRKYVSNDRSDTVVMSEVEDIKENPNTLWEIYTSPIENNKLVKFSVKYPSDWKVTETRVGQPFPPGYEVIITSEKTLSAQNIDLFWLKATQLTSNEEFYSYQDFIDTDTDTIDNVSVARGLYPWSEQAGQLLEMFFVKDGVGYILSTRYIGSYSSISSLPQPQPDFLSTFKFLSSPAPSGSTLKEIRYTIPETWSAEYREDINIGFSNDLDTDLFLYPTQNGGYIAVMALNYDPSTGRRTHFCTITNVCIDATSFEEVKIGNIDGYLAKNIDSSGSGPMYFGAKGNMFYLIGTYAAPGSAEYQKHSKAVFDSLRF